MLEERGSYLEMVSMSNVSTQWEDSKMVPTPTSGETANLPARDPLPLELSAPPRRRTKDYGHLGTTEESWNIDFK
jgi:hypothetical protein